ncbi:MAG: SCO family protein [Pseudomonadota bacterium]
MKHSSLLSACAAVLLLGGQAWAHDGEDHKAEPAPQVEIDPQAGEDIPFDFEIGGSFELVDHHGKKVTDSDFHGAYMMVFFGYANCESICPVGLSRMVKAIDLLGEEAKVVQPVLITVDPENDTVEALAGHVPKIHPRLVGLTGTPEQLAAARKAYRVDSKAVGKAWDGKPIFSHGSFLYLMAPDGSFATLIPPVLSPEAMAKTIRKYLAQAET